MPVKFAGQTDLVIWDAKRGIEHFVRDARFEAKGDIGFLAPTPTVPELAAVSSQAFDLVAQVISTSRGGGGQGGGAAGGGVKVVKVQEVGAYTAAVLHSGDAEALGEWLEANDFPAPKWLEEWVQPYLDKGWTIIAFKLREGANVVTGPVRMSFRTKTPFAPYAVPKENGGSGSRLRLFLLSAKELEVALGRELWSVPERNRVSFPEEKRAELARHLKLPTDAIPGGATVASYYQMNFGKEAKEDLYCIPAAKSIGSGSMTGSSAVVPSLLALTALGGVVNRHRRLQVALA